MFGVNWDRTSLAHPSSARTLVRLLLAHFILFEVRSPTAFPPPNKVIPVIRLPDYTDFCKGLQLLLSIARDTFDCDSVPFCAVNRAIAFCGLEQRSSKFSGSEYFFPPFSWSSNSSTGASRTASNVLLTPWFVPESTLPFSRMRI
jgi:hypothetical protein